MMDLAAIDAALLRLPVSPVTDADIAERARLTQRRYDVISAAAGEAMAKERGRAPQPWWVAVRVPEGLDASAYYPADGNLQAPYYATVEDGRRVIYMEPHHARQLLISDAAFKVAQDADLMLQLFPRAA